MIKKLNSFSLIEVLLSILIISVILVLLVPVVTMKKRKSDIQIRGNSAVFLFTKHNMPRDEEYLKKYWCFRTNYYTPEGSDVKYNYLNWATHGQCQMYEFTIPKGVYRVSIAMMGGGGGGGGAAGSILYTKEFYSPNRRSGVNIAEKLINVPKARIKELKLNALVGKGAIGIKANTDASASYVYAGDGGASGPGIFDATILGENVKEDLGVFYNEFEPKIDMEFINKSYLDALISGEEASTYSSGTSRVVSFPGIGLALDMKTADGTYKREAYNNSYDHFGKKVYYVADQPIGDYKFLLFWGCPENSSSGYDQFKRWLIYTSGSGGGYSSYQGWGVHESRFVSPKAGGKSSLSYTGNIQNGFIIPGGKGAGYDYATTRIGEGSRGQARQVSCAYNQRECLRPDNIAGTRISTTGAMYNASDYTMTRAFGRDDYRSQESSINYVNFGHASLTLEHPPGVGGGGAAGTFYSGLEFRVKPGTKYKIIVGAGGGGGNPGGQGSVNATGVVQRAATPGHDGMAGSSSAVYDEDGNLVFLVTGGLGGFGGSVNNAAYTVPTAVQTTEADGSTLDTYDFANYAPNPSLPKPTRSIPVFLRGKKYDGDIDINTDFIEKIMPTWKDDSSLGIKGTDVYWLTVMSEVAKQYRVINANLYSEYTPYFALNANNPKTAMGETVDPYNQDENDGYLGGFSAYRNDEIANLGDAKFLNPRIGTIGWSSTTYGAYSGLYFKYLNQERRVKLYQGGLGGISALGTKAGCGGLFVGNQDGYDTDDTTTNPGYFAGTFGIRLPKDNKAHFYQRDLYFDGCTDQTPDGHTAKFEAPQIIDTTTYYGAAGAGGGGGGYAMNLGSGKGGDGQNGYVFISWTAPHK